MFAPIMRTIALLFVFLIPLSEARPKFCCLPDQRSAFDCTASHVVRIPEQHKLLAVSRDGKKILIADFYGPSFVPFNATMTERQILLRNNQPFCGPRTRCTIKNMMTVADGGKTVIHMIIDHWYVQAFLQGTQLRVTQNSTGCVSSVPVFLRKLIGCEEAGNKTIPALSYQQGDEVWVLSPVNSTNSKNVTLTPLFAPGTEAVKTIPAPGLIFYTRFTWKNGKKYAMALVSYGFLCVYEWSDERSDDVLSRAGKLMPECVPQSLLFDCPPSFCTSPRIDTIEYDRHLKTFSLFRGFRKTVSLPPVTNEHGVQHVIELRVPEFSEYVHFESQILRISAISPFEVIEKRGVTGEGNMFFLSESDTMLYISNGTALQLEVLDLFDPVPDEVVAAWNDIDSQEYYLFNEKSVFVYTNQTIPGTVARIGKEPQLISDLFSGVRSVDSIFEIIGDGQESSLVIVRNGRYAKQPRNNWRSQKWTFHPLPYHLIHSPEGLVDISECQWTESEEEEYFDRLQLMWSNEPDVTERSRQLNYTVLIVFIACLFLLFPLTALALFLVLKSRSKRSTHPSVTNRQKISGDKTSFVSMDTMSVDVPVTETKKKGKRGSSLVG